MLATLLASTLALSLVAMAVSTATARAMAVLAVTLSTMSIVEADVALVRAVALAAVGTGAVLEPRADRNVIAIGDEPTIGVLVIELKGASTLLRFLGRWSSSLWALCARGSSHDMVRRATGVHVCDRRVSRDQLSRGLRLRKGE